MSELCKNGIKQVSMVRVSFTCSITREDCKYAKWCFRENNFKMLYPYCEEECDNCDIGKDQ